MTGHANLAELRALAEAAGEREWGPAETSGDVSDGSRSWQVGGVVRWNGYTNVINCGDDEATARFLAAVHPLAVLEVVDGYETLAATQPHPDRRPVDVLEAFVWKLETGHLVYPKKVAEALVKALADEGYTITRE